MALKKLKLSVPTTKRPVDPLELFNRLTLRRSIKNIWEPQAEALKEWHKKRDHHDVVVRINTGGGKTLVGLLMAQSLTNETKGKVLYVCPNNQLVEQTLSKASEVSLTPASRFKGAWSGREGFDAGEQCCVTNYAAVFNGKSVVAGDDIEAVVFDDAHVAEHAIRSKFTLTIPSTHKAFAPIIGEIRRHFATSGLGSRLQDTLEGRPGSFLFVPTFVVWQHATLFRKALIDSGVASATETMFEWEHVREHLHQCSILIGPRGLEIAPPVLPLSQLPLFSTKVRRIYLTATMPSQAAFVRTFGVRDPVVVEPSGKSGDAQRLFVFVPGVDNATQRAEAKSLAEGHKSCVISPSSKTGKQWVPPARLFDREGGHAEIDKFANSDEPAMLGLVARYDGIDLPGDACRILILDRLPFGELLIDRFVDESIQVEALRTSHTATRIVQAIGRIFRSNTDHGVVLLVGTELQSWLRNKRNAGFLPKLLQQQLLLASELAKLVAGGETSWADLMDALLNGDEQWDSMYREYIEQFESVAAAPATDWYINLVQREHEAFSLLWQQQYRQAADLLSQMEADAKSSDKRLAAWYGHWRGLALMCADDREGAFGAYAEAANIRAELGRPSVKRDGLFKFAEVSEAGDQAKRLAAWYRKKRTQLSSSLAQVESDLIYGPDTNRAEEAVKLLGRLLGLEAERPDKTDETGPDVKWSCGGPVEAWGLELKTNKDASGEYSKSDIAQCHDHEEALAEKHGTKARLAIVGHLLAVSEHAHPSAALRVIPLEQFHDLLGRAKSMVEAVESGDKADLEKSFQKWLTYHGLLWPTCVEALECRLAVDLRDRE